MNHRPLVAVADGDADQPVTRIARKYRARVEIYQRTGQAGTVPTITVTVTQAGAYTVTRNGVEIATGHIMDGYAG
jgi:hypothetical protein